MMNKTKKKKKNKKILKMDKFNMYNSRGNNICISITNIQYTRNRSNRK